MKDKLNQNSNIFTGTIKNRNLSLGDRNSSLNNTPEELRLCEVCDLAEVKKFFCTAPFTTSSEQRDERDIC